MYEKSSGTAQHFHDEVRTTDGSENCRFLRASRSRRLLIGLSEHPGIIGAADVPQIHVALTSKFAPIFRIKFDSRRIEYEKSNRSNEYVT